MVPPCTLDSMRPARRRIALLGGTGLFVTMCACAPRAVDEQGGEVGDLYDFFLVVATGVFVIVVGLISWSIVRYRERPGDDLPKQFHSNIGLELLWFAIPQVIVVGLFVVSLSTLNTVEEVPADPSVTVRVEGFQWGWRFDYDDADVAVTSRARAPAELVLPVGEEIVFEITSADVVHSFYVPRFLVKRDTLPGRVNELSVTLTEQGAFRGACAEFCGLLHAYMDFTVRAVPSEEFDDWLAEQATT
jgi:cytochrome c oxidase subunit II